MPTDLLVGSHVGGKVRVQRYVDHSDIEVAGSFLKGRVNGLGSNLERERERERE